MSTGFYWSGAGSDVDEELSKYLSDKSTDVMALNCYQLIRKLYIELNTGLPASAAVETCETVFSGGGRVFSPLRSKIRSEHFQMMLFMRSVKL